MSIPDTMLPQATATGEADGGVLAGHIDSFNFAIGGPDGLGGKQAGANPYDLLSASLAACTALTIRAYARRKGFQLARLEIGVSYHRLAGARRNYFDRVIGLQGTLSPSERAELLTAADQCPVGHALAFSADIRTRTNETEARMQGQRVDYNRDFGDIQTPNIDPD